jgi:hypothetical protein
LKRTTLLPTFRPHARTADSVGLPLTTGSFPSYKSQHYVKPSRLLLHTHPKDWYAHVSEFL